MLTPESAEIKKRPLQGLTVVGVEHSVAGPLCTRILAELGATVVKVERPGGDFARHWDENAAGESAQFWWLNRGKRSIALNLKDPADSDVFERLLDEADVLVENLSPAAAERLGFASPAFAARHPRLIHCQITGYGANGMLRGRKAYDMLVQAETGIMAVTGTPEQPTRVGVSLCDIGTGIYAAALVLAAVLERKRTGRGRHLDVAMMDVALEYVGPMLTSFVNAGVVYPRIPQHHHAIAPYGVYTCHDGTQLLLAIEQDDEWRLVCEHLLGDPAIADDPRFRSNSTRVMNRGAVDGLIGGALDRLTGERAVALFEQLGLAYAQLNDIGAVAEHPVVTERRLLTPVPSAVGAVIHAPVGIAERLFSGAADHLPRPPELNEHAAEIRAGLKAVAPSRVAGDRAPHLP